MECKGLQKGDKVLSPSFYSVWGDDIVDEEEAAYSIITEGQIPLKVYGLPPSSLKKFLRTLWEITGRVFSNKGVLSIQLEQLHPKVSRTDLKLLIRGLQHLLLKIGVSTRLDNAGNILIYDEIDKGLFLFELGVTDLLIDTHSPRKWETVVHHKPIGDYPGYQVRVDSHHKNIILNNIVVATL